MQKKSSEKSTLLTSESIKYNLSDQSNLIVEYIFNSGIEIIKKKRASEVCEVLMTLCDKLYILP